MVEHLSRYDETTNNAVKLFLFSFCNYFSLPSNSNMHRMYSGFMLLYPNFTFLVILEFGLSPMSYIPRKCFNRSDVQRSFSFSYGLVHMVVYWIDMKIMLSSLSRRCATITIMRIGVARYCIHRYEDPICPRFIIIPSCPLSPLLPSPAQATHFFRSVLTFSHPLRRAVCLIRRGGRRVETRGRCGVGCEEHTGVRWGVPRCPVWLRNNHWSSRLDS